MPLPPPSLDAINTNTVRQAEQQLYQTLAEAYPDVDLTRGFVHDIPIQLGAVITALIEESASTLTDSQSLLAIEQNPALADPSLVDALLSNFRITRRTGTAATGRVTVIIDTAIGVVVPSGTAFTSGTLAFVTNRAYNVRTSSALVVGPSDIALAAIGDGRYSFSVDVTAATAGVDSMIRGSTAISPQFPIPHLVRAYADGDFSGGYNPETNADLVARLRTGVAASTFSNRGNVTALIQQSTAFGRVLQLSIVGAGDAEMLRDKHTIFPLAHGFGRADVYARTTDRPLSVAASVTASFVGNATGGGLWQFSVPRSLAPGFYEISRVALPGAPQSDVGFSIVSDTRGVDLSGSSWVPDVTNAIEGSYSPYQTATVRFIDTVTSTLGLIPNTTTADYDITLVAMPQIAAMQAFLGGRQVRGYGGDVLVKAPVPCFMRFSFEVSQPASSAATNVSAIQSAVASYVNNLGFVASLPLTAIASVVVPLLPVGASLGRIDAMGRIRRPDGVTQFLRDPYAVAVVLPDDPGTMTTARTTAFILDPADVAVTVSVAASPTD